MGKNRVKLNVCGISCALLTEDEKEYVGKVGKEVEGAILSLTSQNEGLSLVKAAIVTALSFCDEKHKQEELTEGMRAQVRDYLSDSSRARMEADEARKEIERLKKEIETLRARLEQQKRGGGEEEQAPVKKPNGEAPTPVRSSFYNPLHRYITPEQEGFMSFFEKKENGE